MIRYNITTTVGINFLTTNVEEEEYSYVKAAGGEKQLETALGHPRGKHFKLDRRFEDPATHTVVLIETKQNFIKSDEAQLEEYLEEERALNHNTRVICILANTTDNKIKVWQSVMDDNHILKNEIVLDSMEHYIHLFDTVTQNDREQVLRNTYALNEMLHKKDIDEKLRSQFVGTVLLHVKELIKRLNITYIGSSAVAKINDYVNQTTEKAIRSDIENTLDTLLDGTDNKAQKIRLLQKNVLDNQKVKKLNKQDWQDIFNTIMTDIYRYINTNSSEGQDILNLFFIAFNKYTGKADKNQAFTPDHITDFMCRITDIDWTKRILDPTCGSGSFLVQAMVKELSNARIGKGEEQARRCMETVRREHIYGIECEENVYGLATTNMLIHSDGNSNIKLASCFDLRDWIKDVAKPDIILMNPPYNAKPKTIPEKYKTAWGNAEDGKEDPTKGLVFIHYLSDIIEEANKEHDKKGEPRKTVQLAVLLPLAAAIGTSKIIENEKITMLENNTLEAVFSLPAEIFYPGASVNACCMVFTLGQPHVRPDGTIHETFFGYCKDDGFVKKKNLGRVEQFVDKKSVWKSIETEWLDLYRNKKAVDGKSAVKTITGKDEWLCEAYMKTDYSKLTEADFQKTVNNYLAYLVKDGQIIQEGK